MRRDRAIAIATIVVGLFLLAANLRTIGPFTADDSFISYRYARNLAAGDGLTFNVGEHPVESYSNFLWILICTAVARLGEDIPSVAPLIGVLAMFAGLGVLWLLTLRQQADTSLKSISILIYATTGPLALYAISGLETALFALLLLASLYFSSAVLRNNRTVPHLLLSAVGIGVALCRPEGVVCYPFILFFLLILCVREKGPTALKGFVTGALLFGVAMAIYHAWRINYFDSVLPTPFLSKAGRGKSLPTAWRTNFEIYFERRGKGPPFGYYYLGLGLAGWVGLALSPKDNPLRRIEALSLLLATMYSTVYINFVDWYPGLRYNSAIFPLLLLPVVHIFEAVLPTATHPPASSRRRVVQTLGLLGLILVWNLGYRAILRVDSLGMELSRSRGIEALAKWIGDVVPEDVAIALADVGTIPYRVGNPVIDIHPEALTDLHIARNGFSIEYFMARRPSIAIFTARGFPEQRFYVEHQPLIDDPEFERSYELIGRVRYDNQSNNDYYVFKLRDLALPDGYRSSFPGLLGDRPKEPESATS